MAQFIELMTTKKRRPTGRERRVVAVVGARGVDAVRLQLLVLRLQVVVLEARADLTDRAPASLKKKSRKFGL